MKHKQNFDERISKLQKEIIEQIQFLVNNVDEKEIRINEDLAERNTKVFTITNDSVIFKKHGIFTKKVKSKYEDIPFFILLDILDLCENYMKHYLSQKQYEKVLIIKFFRNYKGHLSPTERNFKRLLRKIKNEHPYFIFYEQMELIVRDQLEYYL